jgi:hypothetical protein
VSLHHPSSDVDYPFLHHHRIVPFLALSVTIGGTLGSNTGNCSLRTI